MNSAASRVYARAMGEAQSVSHSLSVSSDRTELSGNFQTGKERLFTPDELMRLPGDQQIIHVKNIGFIHARKIRQNEIGPYAASLADNPLEGTRLPPEHLIDLPTTMEKPS